MFEKDFKIVKVQLILNFCINTLYLNKINFELLKQKYMFTFSKI